MSHYRFRLQCDCGREMKADVSYALPGGNDPRAVALQAAAKRGWVYRNGQMGKSVITVVCPTCRPEPLRLEADVQPDEVVPATYEEDLAVKADPWICPGCNELSLSGNKPVQCRCGYCPDL